MSQVVFELIIFKELMLSQSSVTLIVSKSRVTWTLRVKVESVILKNEDFAYNYNARNDKLKVPSPAAPLSGSITSQYKPFSQFRLNSENESSLTRL